jgi:hypothetical protein
MNPKPPSPTAAPKALKSLATKLKKLKANYKISEAVRAVVGDDATPHAVVASLVRDGLLDPMPNGALLEYLGQFELDAPTGEAVAEALARRDEAGRAVEIRTSSLSWLDGWPAELDAAVYRAWAAAPAAFAGRAERFTPATRRGVAFVARRRGATIGADLAGEIAAELARGQATGYGIAGNSDCRFVGDDGAEVAHSVGDLAALRTLALRFVDAAAWDRALAAATRRNQWGLIENVASAIEQLPLAEITRLFATRFSMFGDGSDADRRIADIMDRRDDPTGALLGELAHVPESERNAARLREVYAEAARRRDPSLR